MCEFLPSFIHIITYGIARQLMQCLLDQVRLKLNGRISVRVARCSWLFACSRDNAVPYLNLLGILTLKNINKFKVTLFTHKITDKVTSLPTTFKGTLTLASEVHSYNTRFASNSNFHRLGIGNYRKATFAFALCKIWEKTQSKFQKPPA